MIIIIITTTRTLRVYPITHNVYVRWRIEQVCWLILVKRGDGSGLTWWAESESEGSMLRQFFSIGRIYAHGTTDGVGHTGWTHQDTNGKTGQQIETSNHSLCLSVWSLLCGFSLYTYRHTHRHIRRESESLT